MRFGFTAEQQTLRQSARDFLQKECPIELVRELQEPVSSGHSSELWQKMAQLGWLGMMLPDELGGVGASLLEVAILYEQAGYFLVPTTLFSTIAGALCILNGGSEAQKRAILPAVAEGKELLTLALSEPNVSLDPDSLRTEARPRGDGYVIEGVKMFIQNAHVADHLIVVARTAIGHRDQSITAFLVPRNTPNVSLREMQTYGRDRQSEVRLDGVFVPRDAVLGEVGRAWAAIAQTLEQITALQCVEMAGGMQRIFEMTVEYMKQRVVFGQVLGAFQAVQHHVANQAMAVDGARFAAFRAVSKLTQGLPSTAEVSTAKAVASDAYREVTLTAHQLHGGIGLTLEYGLHLWSRRSKATQLSLGTRDYHLEKVAQEMGL